MKKIKAKFQKVVHYFTTNRVVYTKEHPPARFVAATEIDGKKYITIAITNIAVKGQQNTAIVHHVKESEVLYMLDTASPFIRWLCYKLDQPLPEPKKLNINEKK